MNYSSAVSAQGSVKSIRGNNDTYHVTTPLMENRGLEKLCVQTSLRTISNKTKTDVLSKVDRALEQRGVKLAEDTYSIDLTANRLVLCFKNEMTAANLVQNTLRLSENEHLKFCVNEPKLWVITIFKVPGYYDVNNHQFLRSFASEFGVVHRIYRKTIFNSGKSYGGPNIIVQYSSLYTMPPRKLMLDGKHNLEIYWTKPSRDMFHPEHVPTQYQNPESLDSENQIDFATSKGHDKNPKLKVTIRNGEEGNKRAIEVSRNVPESQDIDMSPHMITGDLKKNQQKQQNKTEQRKDDEPFQIVTKNKHGRLTTTTPSTPAQHSPPPASMSGIESIEGEMSTEYLTEVVPETEGDDINPEEKISTWDESPVSDSKNIVKESQRILQFSSSSEERDTPTNRARKRFTKTRNKNKDSVTRAKEERMLGAVRTRLQLSPPKKNTPSPRTHTPPKVHRHLSAENMAKCLEPTKLTKNTTKEATRKRNTVQSPKITGLFRSKEPANKKEKMVFSDAVINAKHHLVKRSVAKHHKEAEGAIKISDSNEITCLGPISWILMTGQASDAWHSFIANKISTTHTLADVKGLPNGIKQQQISLRCNTNSNKQLIETSWKTLVGMKEQALGEEVYDIIRKYQHLFHIDVMGQLNKNEK